MSQSIFIDESNGNGVFAVKGSNNSTIPITTSSVVQNNFNTTVLANSISSEDLSQSLSEYTDADESMSAPTEFLAEFLSSVMLKDYERALKYCKLILEYEPNNATAKEFYPLIQEKLNAGSTTTCESDENDNRSSSPDLEIEEMKLEDSDDEDNDDVEVEDDDDDDDVAITSSSSTGSNNSNDSVDDTSEDSEENIQKASNGSSGNSENTTHSYSSLLLEEEEDEAPNNLHIKDLSSHNLDASNGNLISASCSDSESPTEPLTQRLAAILLSKYVTGKKN